MANANWPQDAPDKSNPFLGGGGLPVLNHQHIDFVQPGPDDVDEGGRIRPGTMLTLSGIDPSLPVGCVLVYLYDGANDWARGRPVTVIALAPYGGPAGSPVTVQTTQSAMPDMLRPIAVESLDAWRAWTDAWDGGGGGGTGSAGDGNSSHKT